MSFFDSHLLSLVVFVPLVFALLVALLPASEHSQIRTVTFIGMLVDAALGVWAYLAYDPAGPEFQLEQRVRWIDSLGVSYHVGVDGIAASLLLLTVFLGPLVVLASTTYITERRKEFHLALLVLQTVMLGALVSLDVLLFYIFFEAMLIPMYLLVGVWGSEDRQMAAVKFFLYTLAGSLVMLVALIAVYFLSGPPAAARSTTRASTTRCCRRTASSRPAPRRAPARASRGSRARCTPGAPGCSAPSRWPSPSRCRCSRCTPGCRTRTFRRRWPAR
jgi:NADH-quinone oxidoreductase subunit M